jgi:hypothetical protein
MYQSQPANMREKNAHLKDHRLSPDRRAELLVHVVMMGRVENNVLSPILGCQLI